MNRLTRNESAFCISVIVIGLALCLAFGIAHAQDIESSLTAAKEVKALRRAQVEVFDATAPTDTVTKYVAKVYAAPKYKLDKATGLYEKPVFSYDKGKFTHGGRYVEYVPRFTVADKQITVRTEQTAMGVKEYITVYDAQYAGDLAWDIKTDATPTVNKDGSITFTDGGAFLFKTAAPIAWDANDKPVTVTASVSGGVLSYALDADGAEWPVTVDPSTIVVRKEDSSRSLAFPDTLYSVSRNSTVANVAFNYIGQRKFDSGVGIYYYSYRIALTFDLSSVTGTPDSARVVMPVTNDLSTTDFDIRLVEPTFTGTSDNGWYNDFTGWETSGVYTPTYHADAFNTSSLPADTLRISLNEAGLAALNTGGDTRIFMISSRDISETEPAGNEYVVLGIGSAYMEVWYTVSGWTGKVSGVTNPAKVMGVEVANIKSVMGVE